MVASRRFALFRVQCNRTLTRKSGLEISTGGPGIEETITWTMELGIHPRSAGGVG